MKAARRLLVGIPAAAAMIVIAAYDLGAGLANAEARAISLEVDSWAARGTSPRPDTADSLQADLGKVAPRLPDQAYGDELAGVISTKGLNRSNGMAAAKSFFSKALGTRAVSPYTWANLAHVQYELGQTGEEFEVALRHAVELGPWEPPVQATVVNYGLAVREEVGPKTRAAIDQMVSNAMRRNPLETLQIAERRGRLDIACQKLVNPAAETIKRFTQCQ